MNDVTDAREFMVIKSDQMNYEDFISGPQAFIITKLGRKMDKGEPRLMVYLSGREKTPWIPSKGMVKCLSNISGWGPNLKDWIGRSITLFGEPTVMFGGKELGGIRVSHISHIEEQYVTKISERRGVRTDYLIKPMRELSADPYPQAKFDQALPTIKSKLASREITLQQVIAQCQKTGQLSAEQLKALEEAAPVDIPQDENDEEVM